ncbi:sulfite reductase subunit alpha [Nibricoccus sp. IMCC34717]|uniref:sulfite reductase subunit alpha n=1 Tax=Nibricoccus sp. IMCC34717 TaxID=3034021 RepID=UPI00384BE776
MSQVPALPESAPFSAEQRAWLNGFLAGLFSRQGQAQAAPASAAEALAPLTIAWGSQTGTAEGLAKRAAKEAGRRGFAPTVVDLAQLPVSQLTGIERLLVITSTYGDGEPPDNAKAFWTALKDAASASLGKLRFSICALGDTNYPLFCQFGKDIDQKLAGLGATRLLDRVDCETDYEEPFTRWLNEALTRLAPSRGSAAATSLPAPAEAPAPATTEPVYSKANPFRARVLESTKLNAPGSAKAVHHVAFSLANSGLAYEAGDALGVWPCNCPEEVSEILDLLGFDGEEAVPGANGSTLPLRQALTCQFDISRPSAELKARLVPAGVAGTPSGSEPTHVVDFLRMYPKGEYTPASFVGLLRRLQPRLYSISSSPLAHPGEVHLTVGAVHYELGGRPRKGVCSTYLAGRVVPQESEVGVFVHTNRSFRPPENPETPMIMIGPGTGIAPFRAFLEERAARGAKGRNWLFFGDQKASSDFLYRHQLEAWQASGHLTRLNTAFSRDQAEKIYVQHRMLEAGAEFFAWLEAGAHVYVCGDASRMAKDVDRALHQIIEREGKRTAEQAVAYVDALKAAKRYARDVY